MVKMRLTLAAVLALFLVISFCNGTPWNIDDIETDDGNLDAEEVRGLIDGENEDDGVNLLEKRMAPNSMVKQGINTLARAYKRLKNTRMFINKARAAVWNSKDLTRREKRNVLDVVNKIQNVL